MKKFVLVKKKFPFKSDVLLILSVVCFICSFPFATNKSHEGHFSVSIFEWIMWNGFQQILHLCKMREDTKISWWNMFYFRLTPPFPAEQNPPTLQWMNAASLEKTKIVVLLKWSWPSRWRKAAGWKTPLLFLISPAGSSQSSRLIKRWLTQRRPASDWN